MKMYCIYIAAISIGVRIWNTQDHLADNLYTIKLYRVHLAWARI